MEGLKNISLQRSNLKTGGEGEGVGGERDSPKSILFIIFKNIFSVKKHKYFPKFSKYLSILLRRRGEGGGCQQMFGPVPQICFLILPQKKFNVDVIYSCSLEILLIYCFHIQYIAHMKFKCEFCIHEVNYNSNIFFLFHLFAIFLYVLRLFAHFLHMLHYISIKY